MAERKNKIISSTEIPESIIVITNTSTQDNFHTLPFYVGILLVLAYTGTYYMVYLVDDILPRPLMVQNEENQPDSFISERASWDVHNLTNIGPRPVGSYENEKNAVDYITKRIKSIIQQVHPDHYLEQDLQRVSGSFYTFEGVISTYDNVQNIIVKLHGRNYPKTSVLVNSHFDSISTSPGASDDAINVAVMLEILRLLTKSDVRSEHNIIFLFNGAGETSLHGSHGFITKHKWAQECRVFVNLESAGSGGKIMVFQIGAPWVLKYYKRVPHPFGQAGGEELYDMGFIQSDTDYRIFKEFGKLVGLNMAFVKNGHRYHNHYDIYSYIPLGSYQHVGDNALHLIKSLANAPELYKSDLTSNGTKEVYYDFFGLFMITYSNKIGIIINSLTVAFSSLLYFGALLFSYKLEISFASIKYLTITFIAIVGSWYICALFIFMFAASIDFVGLSMTWYSQPWLVYGLYAIPSIGLSGCLLSMIAHETLSLNIRCQIQAHMVRMIWTVLLGAGTILNLRASYGLMVSVLFSSLAFCMIHVIRLEHSVYKWRIVYVVFLILPTIHFFYQFHLALAIFMPITGRMGSRWNPEFFAGFCTGFFTVAITSPLTAMTNCLRNAKYYFLTLALVFGLFVAILMTRYSFPYNGNSKYPTPQRHWILHTSRKIYNDSNQVIKTDYGFFFLNLDRNSPRILKGRVKELSKMVSIEEDCGNYAGCGLPLIFHHMMRIMKWSTWIPAGELILPQPIVLKSTKVVVSENELMYNVLITGPDRMTIFMVPRKNIKLIKLSLVDEITPPYKTFQGRPLYFLHYQRGFGRDRTGKFNFTFNVEVPTNWTEPTMNFTVAGRFAEHNKMKKTTEFVYLLRQMPDWTTVIAWLGAYHAYVL